MAAIVVDLRDHAAQNFHHYYHHREAHGVLATTTTTATGTGTGGEGGGAGGVEGVVAVASEEVEEEGEGAFFDSQDGEEEGGLTFAERRFRRNVTVCMRRAEGGKGVGGGDAMAVAASGEEDKLEPEHEQGQPQQEEEEERLVLPAAEASISPSRLAIGSLLKRRSLKKQPAVADVSAAAAGERQVGPATMD
jgi:hypothetical protein